MTQSCSIETDSCLADGDSYFQMPMESTILKNRFETSRPENFMLIQMIITSFLNSNAYITKVVIFVFSFQQSLYNAQGAVLVCQQILEYVEIVVKMSTSATSAGIFNSLINTIFAEASEVMLDFQIIR